MLDPNVKQAIFSELSASSWSTLVELLIAMTCLCLATFFLVYLAFFVFKLAFPDLFQQVNKQSGALNYESSMSDHLKAKTHE